MNNCVIYARFSSYGQNEQSIEAQTRICKEFAEKKGLKVVKIYSDKAKTGTNDDRPAFQRMIKDAKNKTFQYIIVYMFDRFARNRRDSIMYKETLKEKYGIKVISALEPIADDEGGEFYEMFLEWNAEKYSKRLSKRVKDGLDTSVANGTYCGGQLIYGYNIEHVPLPNNPSKFIKKVVINEEQAQIVRMAFDLYDKGMRKIQIAEELNKQGVFYKGRPFSTSQLDRWLVNQKYTGEFTFGGRQCTNMYPPIIDKELFNRVQERLSKNRHALGGMASAKVPYLLTGKLFCGYCFEKMVSDGGTNGSGVQVHYYTCKNKKKRTCKKGRAQKDALEEVVVKFVVDWLSNDENIKSTVDTAFERYEKRTSVKALKSIETQIANAKNEISALTDAYVSAKNTLLRQSIEIKMNDYEILLNNLNSKHNTLELERGIKVSKADLTEYIKDIVKGDIKDKEFQKKIIDSLVYKVYAYDDYVLVLLTIKAGNINNDVPIDKIPELIDLIVNDSVQTQEPPSRH